MKQNIWLFLFFVTPCFYLPAQAQETTMHYTYDNAGNRISRMQVSMRSFTPFSQETDEERILDEFVKTKVNVYPNPVQSDLSVAISDLPDGGSWKLLLFDMSGKLVCQRTYDSMQITLPMSALQSGEYIVKLIFNQSQSVWKIIKN